MRTQSGTIFAPIWVLAIAVIPTLAFSVVAAVAQQCPNPPSTSNTYYIDCDTGNANNSGLDWGHAWRNIKNSISLVPDGSTINVRGTCADNDIAIGGRSNIIINGGNQTTVTKDSGPGDGFVIRAPASNIVVKNLVISSPNNVFQNGIHVARNGSVNSVSNITISHVTIAMASTKDSGVAVDAKGSNVCFDTVTVNNAGNGITDPNDETKANGFFVNVESSFGSLTGLQFIQTVSTVNKRDGYAFSPHAGNGISHPQFYGAEATGNSGDGFDLSGTTPELYNIKSTINGIAGSHQQGRGIIFWTDGYVESAIVASNQASGIVATASGGNLTLVSSTLSDNDRAITTASSREQLQNGNGALTIYDAVISGPGKSVVGGQGSVNCDYNLFGGTSTGNNVCYGAHSHTADPTLNATYYLVSAGAGVSNDGVDDGIDPRTPLGTQVKYAGTLDRNLGCRPKDGDGNGSFLHDVGALETGSGACQGTPPSPTRTITPTQPPGMPTSTLRPTPTPKNTSTPTMTRTVTATPSISPTTAPTTTPCSGCVGNCNADCTVTVNELIKGVQIALDSAPLSECPGSDPNSDQLVTIGELIAAVANALEGCGHMSLLRAAGPQSRGWWGLRDAAASDLRLVVLRHPKKSVRGDALGTVWLSTGGNKVGTLKFDLEYPEAVASLVCWPEQEVMFETLELGNRRIRVVVGDQGFPTREIVAGAVLSCNPTSGERIGTGKKNLHIIRATAADVFGNPLPIAVGDASQDEGR